MKEAVPNYYHKFKCIAGRCKHSCCIGWEIDIDEDTMALYQSLVGEMGERIRAHIEGDEPHFTLQADERCPFLNEQGLCEIICAYGDGALCDICTLHPRFRNFYSSFVEVGLGLCCEEAAGIILRESEKFSIVLPQEVCLSEEEEVFFNTRQKIFGVLQNREKSIGARFLQLAQAFGFEFDFSLEKLSALYLSLERLDEQWTEELNRLSGFVFTKEIFENDAFQILFEQLAVYFVFRHLAEAMWDGMYAERIGFALLSCYCIGALSASYIKEKGTVSMETMIDIVRMYSSEVEYSEENMETILYSFTI